MMRIDRKNMVLSVKSGSVITKNLKFDGTVVAGIDCSFLGNIVAKEVNLGRGCVIGGVIRAEEVTVGAYSSFNEIEAEDVVVLVGCRGNRITAKGDVRIAKDCEIGEIKAGNRLLIEGNSKIEKMEARKIIAYG